MRFSTTLTLSLVLTGAVCGQGPWNLLDNGGGDTPVARRLDGREGRAFDLPGWTVERGDWVAQAGGWSDVTAPEGRSFLRATAGEVAELWQEAPLPAGAQWVIAGAFCRTLDGRDRAELRLEVLDAARQPLVSRTTGPIAGRAWACHEVLLRAPKGAATARVTLLAERRHGKAPDVFFDGVVLEAFGKGVGLAEPVPALLGRLESSADRDERRAVLRALAGHGRRGFDALAAVQEKAAASDERRYALTVRALGGDERTRAGLAEALAAEDAVERQHALGLLAVVDFDVGAVLSAAARGTDARRRAAALEVLAARADTRSVRALARLAGDPAVARDVLRAVRAARPPADAVYRPLLAPWLDRRADPLLRHEAMTALAALGDRRYLQHLAELGPHEPARNRLVEWFRAAAAFDDPEALRVMVDLVDARLQHAPGAFLAAVPTMRAPAIAEWLRGPGLAHAEPAVRLAAVRTLQAIGTPADAAHLRRAAADADPLVAIGAVEALAAIEGGRIEDHLGALLARAEGPVAAAALRALAERTSGAVRTELARQALAHAKWQVRTAALELLAGAADEALRATFTAACADPIWQVRVAAYRALAKLRTAETVGTLIGRLAQESGAARFYLADEIVALTGVDYGAAPEVWERWWNVVADGFRVPDTPQRAADRSAGDGRTTTAYYGIPLRADNIVFVIDLSGSMDAAVDGTTRLRRAQDELIGVLRKLEPPRRFNVVAFGTLVESWQKELVVAEPRQIEDAVRWVDGLTSRGATNIYDSLELALRMEGVEAVFLLSDGGPSWGKFIDMNEIRRVIRAQNRDRLVRINTVSIGGGGRAAEEFMRLLAEENDGVHRVEK